MENITTENYPFAWHRMCDAEQKANSEGEPATAAEVIRLRAVLVAAQEYIAAVKEQQKGGVGRAWAQLVKTVHACEEESPD